MSDSIHGERRRRSGRTTGAARMADVARLAGVGLITVSRVLNDPGKVAPETRAVVQAAIQRVGYVPNLIAGGLASNRSRVVGVVVPTITNSIFADTVQGLSDVLEAKNYSILLGQTGYDSEREQRLIATMLGRRAEGLIAIGCSQSDAVKRMLRAAGVPIVQTWDIVEDPVDLLVGFSNFEAGRAMTEHLIARGYRRIAFLGGSDPRSFARGKGYEAALEHHDLAPAQHVQLTSPASIGAGRDAVRILLAAEPRIEAAFFATDVFAMGALAECLRAGAAVPARIAIAGFGDLEVASHMVPTLTTVKIRGYEIGHSAAEMLLNSIGGRDMTRKVIDLGFEIVARQST
jgi:LacI family transcriptional regulator, gluconate utilization system Gnt-I transcriptional repressor